MRFSTFLLGGICGAAAVMYLSGRNKSMMWSALTNNSTLGNMMNRSNDKSDANKNNFAGGSSSAKSGNNEARSTNNAGNDRTASYASSTNQANSAQSSNIAQKRGGTEEVHSSGSIDKVADIVKEDPKLKSQVEEIMASNNRKKEIPVH